jgi:hypothetical protein
MTAETDERPVESNSVAVATGTSSEQQGDPEVHQELNNHGRVENQVNTKTVVNQHNYFPSGEKPPEPVGDLLEDLGKLPSAYHPYRHPLHHEIISDLEQHRIVALTSDTEEASFVAGHAVATDPCFAACKKRALFVTRLQDVDRRDLDLMSVTAAVLPAANQILLVEIARRCTLLESILDFGPGALASISEKLEQKSCYIVLSIDESLLENERSADRIRPYHRRTVSHLQYLLSRRFPARAAELEARLLAVAGSFGTFAERRGHYRAVESALGQSAEAFEKYLATCEATAAAPPEERETGSAESSADLIFKEDSELHKTAAFVAASFPELGQKDFDRFVRLMIRDETTTKEEVRHAFRRDGKLVTVREKKEERCTDVWSREADRIFHDCALRTIASATGSWVVDFCNPRLRADVRARLNERYPWYLRRQCERLQESGIFFDATLSMSAVEGLARLYVDRAIVDPTDFGSVWLLDLVRGRHRDAAKDSGVLNERLSILIREMAAHDDLIPVVRQFFEYLLRTSEHDALLDLILEPGLRYVADFDPFIWMRRLLNEGNAAVRGRTIDRLLYLARRAGPRIYEFLATIHSWMPDPGRAPENYSFSEVVALEFPFTYSSHMAQWVTSGTWPSDHPLFYSLPAEPAHARKTVGELIDWLIDARGAALEQADASDPLKTAEAVRIAYVADLVEHWAWILEGGPTSTPPREGQALLAMILAELVVRLESRERTWLQRAWQRRQEEQLREAAMRTGTARTNLIARKAKLDQLRVLFASQATTQKIQIQGEPKS